MSTIAQIRQALHIHVQRTFAHSVDYSVGYVRYQYTDQVQGLHYVTQGTNDVRQIANPSKERAESRLAVGYCTFKDSLTPIERRAQFLVANIHDASEPLENRRDPPH